MRRFGRRRRGGSTGEVESAPLDAGRWLARLGAEGIAPAAALEPLEHPDVPPALAVVGRGAGDDGTAIVAVVAPRRAGDALLAALATGARLAEEEGFAGRLLAIAPDWSIDARRRLGLVRAELPYRLEAVAAPGLAEEAVSVESEAALEPTVLAVEQVIAQVAEPRIRSLFQRAAASLEGLASKHGGAIRGSGQSVELVLLARRVAELRAATGRVTLTTLEPQRSVADIDDARLAAAFDGLEGQLRRHLGDRKLRDGEEGMRTRVIPLLAQIGSLRATAPWPLGGSGREELDLAGLDADGHPVVGAARATLSLRALGGILDAAQAIRLALPGLFASAPPPVRVEAPRLLLGAQEWSHGALRALSGLALAHQLFEIRSGRDQGFELVPVAAEEAVRSLRDRAIRERGRPRQRGPAAEREAAAAAPAGEKQAAAEAGEAPDEAAEGEPRGRGRRRGRRRGRGRGEREDRAPSEAEGRGEQAGPRQFEEVSLFDLDEGAGADEELEESGSGRRRRGRSRRRGRRGGEDASEAESRAPGPAARESRPRERDGQVAADANAGEEADSEPEEEFSDAEDLMQGLAELPEEIEAPTAARAEYVDEEGGDEEPEDDFDLELERARSRRARQPEVEAPRPRRRACIVVHQDRDSLLAGILLARDIRLIEGLRIYPQSELMNFFRAVATDLREDVPIHLIGFVPSPARDVIQAASLYRDRLTWFDHHDWPPEDVPAIQQAVGADAVHHTPGVGSSVPAMLATCTRRSRFSDKLVDLATGRFSEHDFERWGRLWLWRLAEIAKKTGDVRADVELLLAGRPSDLAKEAALVQTPPWPPEVDYAAGRDFRLVHFAGYAMVVVDVATPGLDLHLVARIARERYGASLSLAFQTGSDLFLFAGEELAGRRMLDFAALSEHLGEKLDWVETLANDDHVARFRVRDLGTHPERLDEVIGEIAMGRSILER